MQLPLFTAANADSDAIYGGKKLALTPFTEAIPAIFGGKTGR